MDNLKVNLRGLLHTVVNIGGNALLWELVPDGKYRLLSMAAFNLLQVLYSFTDPTYTVHMLGKKN